MLLKQGRSKGNNASVQLVIRGHLPYSCQKAYIFHGTSLTELYEIQFISH